MTNLIERVMRLPPERRAHLLSKLKHYGKDDSSLPQLKKRSADSVVCASFQQEQLWFIDALSEGTARNNVVNLLTFRGPLNIQALEKALNQIVLRHEVLRTSIKRKDEGIIQDISLPEKNHLKLVDLTSLPNNKQEKSYSKYIDDVIQTKFDLSQPPLFRAILFILNSEEYKLIWVIHHIAWDAASLMVFIDDLREFYNSFITLGSDKLSTLTIQYSDYALWYKKMIQENHLKTLKNFWEKELKGLEPTEILPDFPRPKKITYDGKRISLDIEGEILSELKNICVSNNLTFFMAMLSIFNVLLHYYTGNKDLVIGTPTANRVDPALNKLIGLFVNMVVIRTKLEPNLTFKEFLLSVREKVLSCFSNQLLPFEKLVEYVNPSRDSSRHPLFQIEFTTESTHLEEIKLTDKVSIDSKIIHDNASRFDLSFIANNSENKIKITIEYNTQLYHFLTIETLLQNFTHILHTVVLNPNIKISDIVPNSKQNIYKLTEIANGLISNSYDHQTIIALFEEKVKIYRDKVAITFGDTKMTYEELDKKADKLASIMIKEGIKSESRIGIYLDRSSEMVISIIAAFKAGAAYVPLEKEHPKERIHQILASANLTAIVTDTICSDILNSYSGAEKIFIFNINEQSEDNFYLSKPKNSILPDNLAYIIFTSGSTGIPKGVMISHRAVTSFITSINRSYQIIDQDNIIQYASLSFDVSVFDIFSTLTSGAHLIIASKEERRDHEKLSSLLKKNKVTIAELPPAILPLLHADDFPNLRLLSVGGELPSAEIVNIWQNNNRRVVNGYGPTETTVAVTLMECNKPLTTNPPIGKPIDNHFAYVVNDNFELVPYGVPGELLISGPSLARGYCNSAAVTAEKFIPNPFLNKKGDRLYRTGDLVRWLPDGNLQFLGRIDRQVKIRGHRVELSDVEAYLMKLPDVKQAAVDLISDKNGNKTLEAFVVGTGNVTSIRNDLRGLLPDYMIPDDITFLDKIPLTANDKVNYKLLPSLCNREKKSNVQQEPLDDIELKILNDIYSAVLRKENIKLQDSFFDVGGNSIQATQIVSRIRAIFGINFSLAEFFEFLSIKDVSESIKEKLADKTNSAQENFFVDQILEHDLLNYLNPVHTSLKIYPCSYAQHRMYIQSTQLGMGHILNIMLALELEGLCHQNILTASLNQIIERHDSLRISFKYEESELKQDVNRYSNFNLAIIDYQHLSKTDFYKKLDMVLKSEQITSFDMTCSPLIRGSLLKQKYDKSVLVLVFHHAIFDGYSLNLFCNELFSIYNARIKGTEIQLPLPTFQQGDFSLWEKKLFTSDQYPKILKNIKKYIGNNHTCKTSALQNVYVTEEILKNAYIDIDITKEQTQILKKICTDNKITLYILLLSVYSISLSLLIKEREFFIGSPIAGRSWEEFENVIGMFVNEIPVKIKLNDKINFNEQVKLIQRSATECYGFQNWSFDKIKKDLDLNNDCLYQTFFALQNTIESNIKVVGMKVKPYRMKKQPLVNRILKYYSPLPKYLAVSLAMSERKSGIAGTLEYNPKAISANRIKILTSKFMEVIRLISVDQEIPMHQLLKQRKQIKKSMHNEVR